VRINSRRFVLVVVFAGCMVILGLAWSTRERALPLGIHLLNPDDADLQASDNLGAQYIVQVFAWSEMEPTQGEFHWEYTDWLVRAAEYYHLRIVARLDKPPGWATSVSTPYSAPPNRLQDYGRFVAQVAARYRGQIAAYIVWNEPNLAREWGNRAPDPAAYAALLRTAAASLRAADPHALVVSAGLAPTNDRSAQAMDDREFLRAMYAAGARSDFDVLAAHPYSFAQPPDDPHGAHGGLNFWRLQDLRDVMVANGDAAKPIWITEFGYPTVMPASSASQEVSEEQQAHWLPLAYEIARDQMPFVGEFTVWNVTHAVSPEDQVGYSLVRADGSPKPSYAAVQSMPKASVPSQLSAELTTLFAPAAIPSTFPVLARDAEVHLGDGEYPWPWVPLYHDKNPSVEWTGDFYLRESDLQSTPRGQPWVLSLELMQVNTLDGRVLVNDQAVDPPYLPTEDFTSIWVTAQFRVSLRLLHAGHNTVAVLAGDAIPALQQPGSWDDLQLRDLVLHKPGG
jgi:polysaccharide biosynthesis protein PslG